MELTLCNYCPLVPNKKIHDDHFISTPSSNRLVENGLRQSPVVSRSEGSLIAGPVEDDGGPLPSALANSTPSLASRPSSHSPSQATSRQGSPRLPSSPSILSLPSHPNYQQVNGDVQEETSIPEEKEEILDVKPGELNEVTENVTEKEVMNTPVETEEQLTLDEVDGNDENENFVEPEIGTPDTKSLGTPSSEFGSESSKTTETSGNTIESNNNAEEKPRRRAIPRAISLRSRHRQLDSSKERPPIFPPTLPPFENPKDAFLKTILQLENPEWEVVMQGLQGLVRLCRHHNKFLMASAHSIVTAIVHNIRNLRSQVSRGSCQASKEVFDSIGRFLESEVEDLSTALLSRTADTNKFLRGDALSALESMVDHTNPVRSIGILTNKGAKHQNALVRCATSHLLLRLTKRLGAERCLSLPKEPRDALILTGAKLLTEGSLETRRYAKEIFQQLNSDSRLLNVMSEVVPNNVLRNISKVLSKIAITNKR